MYLLEANWEEEVMEACNKQEVEIMGSIIIYIYD